jgi:predicted HTH transcriptional regulator
MPVLLSDMCQALGLLPQECAEVLGQTGYAAVEGALDRRIATTRVRNNRQAMALKYVRKHGRITLTDYRRACPYWSDETLRLDLVGLVKRGLLNKCGSGRGTSYVLSECE